MPNPPAKNVISMHEALNYIGGIIVGSKWKKANWGDFTYKVDTSDLDNIPSETQNSLADAAMEAVVSAFWLAVNDHVLQPFVVLGNRRVYVSDSRLLSKNAKLSIIQHGELPDGTRCGLNILGGRVYLEQADLLKFCKPTDEEFMSPQQKTAGRKKRFDYGKIAALCTHLVVENGDYESQEKLADAIAVLCANLYGDEDTPSIDSIKNEVVRPYFEVSNTLLKRKKSGLLDR